MGTYKFKIGGKEYNVAVNTIEGSNANVTVNGTEYNVEICDAPAAPAVQSAPVVQASAPAAAAAAPAAAPSAGGKKIKSPLPGVIVDVCVKEGQAVKRGQKIAVIEAMKMENEIQAETDGTVTVLNIQKGDSVLEGADIATIA